MLISEETIEQAANHHVGHSEEIDEDTIITAQRESFKWGVKWALDYIAANTHYKDNFNFD